MTAPRFFVQRLDGTATLVRLSPEDSRHALRSLRLSPGDTVSLSDGEASVARARIVREEDGLAVVEVLERTPVHREEPRVTVHLSPPKGDRLVWTTQKLAELGVFELSLLRTERTVRGWEGTRAERVMSRLGIVAREAAMQSRRPFVMRVSGPVALPEALRAGEAPKVMLWAASSRGLRDVLPDSATAVALLVGPEGGFTDTEARAAEHAGGVLASLGEGILRTETAAIVGAALVLARYGRLG